MASSEDEEDVGNVGGGSGAFSPLGPTVRCQCWSLCLTYDTRSPVLSTIFPIWLWRTGTSKILAPSGSGSPTGSGMVTGLAIVLEARALPMVPHQMSVRLPTCVLPPTLRRTVLLRGEGAQGGADLGFFWWLQCSTRQQCQGGGAMLVVVLPAEGSGACTGAFGNIAGYMVPGFWRSTPCQ